MIELDGGEKKLGMRKDAFQLFKSLGFDILSYDFFVADPKEHEDSKHLDFLDILSPIVSRGSEMLNHQNKR